LETIVNYFETIPSSHRSILLVGGITFFWLLEGILPLYKFTYKKWKHAIPNLFFTMTTVIINFALAFLLIFTADWVQANDFGMINWLSDFIRKRGRIVFSILLVIIIIAFVFTIGAGPGIVKGDRSLQERDFYGINLNNPTEVQLLQDATMLSRYINGMQQYDERRFQQEMLFRQVRFHLAETLSIPNPSEEDFRDYIRNKRAFQDESGAFDNARFEGFLDSIKGGARFSENFVTRVLKNDYRMERVDRLLAGPGFVSPAEICKAIARSETSWDVEIASLAYSAFDPEIKIDEDELLSYFNENQFRYEIPAQFEASYVTFTADLVETIDTLPTEEELQKFFISNRSEFEAVEEAQTSEEEDLSPLEVFAKIRSSVESKYIESQKLQQSIHDANDFIAELFEREIAYGSEAFDQALQAYGLVLRDLPSFSADPQTHSVDGIPSALFEETMNLDEDRYFSDVVPASSGQAFYVSFLIGREDARIPALDEVRDTVVQDYRETRKMELFSAKGVELAETIRNEVASGGSFTTIAEEAALEITEPEPFTLSDRPEGIPFQLLQQIEELQQGELSEMITVEDMGYFLYIAEKETPEISEEHSRYEQMKSALENSTAFMRYQATLSELIDQKLSTTR